MPKTGKSESVKRLGARIRASRTDVNMTQLEMAKACGWLNADGTPAQGRLSNYEKGIREPGIDEVRDVARISGKPLVYFYDIENSPGASPPTKKNLKALTQALTKTEALKALEVISRTLPLVDLVRAAEMFAAAALKHLERKGI